MAVMPKEENNPSNSNISDATNPICVNDASALPPCRSERMILAKSWLDQMQHYKLIVSHRTTA
jgi:hypothetical protein